MENGTETRFVYDGGRVIEERRGTDDSVLASYVHGAYIDDVVTMRRAVPQGGIPADWFFHSDDQFSVSAVTNAAGALAERVAYGDYGAPTFFTPGGSAMVASAIGNPYAFTGRRWDAAERTYHYRFRTFSPGLGRFTTRDPIGIWGDALNLGNGYTYTGNDPWSWVDPWGLDGWRGEPGTLWHAAFGTGSFGECGSTKVQTWGDSSGGTKVISAVQTGTTTVIAYTDATTKTTAEGAVVAATALNEPADYIASGADAAKQIAEGEYGKAAVTITMAAIPFVPGSLSKRVAKIWDKGGDELRVALKKNTDGLADAVSDRIARGHALPDHFPGATPEDLTEYINDVIRSPDDFKHLDRGRLAFWDDENMVIVIVDPNHNDLGTAYEATDGYCAFERLK